MTTLTVMPRPASRPQRRRAASGLGRVEEDQEPGQRAGPARRRRSAGSAPWRAGWRRRRPGCRRRTPPASAAARPPAARRRSARRTVSGAPLVTSDRCRRSARTRTETMRRSWSNGSTAERGASGRGPPALCGGESHRAASSGLPPTRRPPLARSVSVAQQAPAAARRPVGAVGGRARAVNVMRPSVSVPVLSVNSTSMSPRSSMQTSRLTSTLRRPAAASRQPGWWTPPRAAAAA